MSKQNDNLLQSAKQCLNIAKSSGSKTTVAVNFRMVISFLNAMQLDEYRDNSDIQAIVDGLSKHGSRVTDFKQQILAIEI